MAIKEFDERTPEDLEPIEFRIPGRTGDVYQATRHAPADLAPLLARIQGGAAGVAGGKLNSDEILAHWALVGEFFDMVLLPESAARWVANMRNPDPTKQVTSVDGTNVFRWLIGEYTGRPTEPGSGSAKSETGTGTSSEATSEPPAADGPGTPSPSGATPSTS